MINYPDFTENHQGEPMRFTGENLHESTLKKHLAFARAIGSVGETLENENDLRKTIERSLELRGRELERTSRMLHYAEQQEEICGQIAKGEFTKP